MPDLRINAVNLAPVRPERKYVLYWMTAQRRLVWNFALDHALALAESLGRPLVILEALRVGYRWASARIHRFVLEGMAVNAEAATQAGLSYYGYVEPEEGAGKGLLQALASDACAVVTDEFPCFFLPRMVAAAGRALDVQLEQVDGNGLLPLHSVNRDFTTAYSFRRHLHKTLPEYLGDRPGEAPLADYSHGLATISLDTVERWPPCPAPLELDLSTLPVDQTVAPSRIQGGTIEAIGRLQHFIDNDLGHYGERRSGLSPYLHFGHIGAHQSFHALAAEQGWDPSGLSLKPTGQRQGWWGMSERAEAFVDELVTWRELGYVFTYRNPDTYATIETLPGWALKTLRDHETDPRPYLYDLETLETATTHDRIWNTAQRELVADGRIHNTLRMLWGKKILEWSATPQVALERLIHLNNKYALDGRNPNSYSGIFWVLGRFDRAWGPERPIYGKVRYMTSERMAKKIPVTTFEHYE